MLDRSKHDVIESSEAIAQFCRIHSEPAKAFAVSFDCDNRTLDVIFKNDRAPVFAKSAVGDFIAFLTDLDRILSSDNSIRIVAYRSPFKGTFNLGGDLSIIGPSLGRGKSADMDRYGRACVDMVWRNWQLVEKHDVVTVALMTGDGLGGGFECALSCNHIALVSTAKVGFPEVSFGAYPGMGSVPFGVRRGGLATVRRMVATGASITAQEAYAAGLVDDIVACDSHDRAHGVMEEWFKQWRASILTRFSAHLARLRCERLAVRVTREEIAANVESMIAGIASADVGHNRLAAILREKQQRRFVV